MTQVTETAQDSNIAVIASVATYVAGLILYTGSLLVMVMVEMEASSWGGGRGREAALLYSIQARPDPGRQPWPQAAEEIIKVLQSRKISEERWRVER